ncbi:hypothetical protein EDD21DRAFT_407823, partial [Dissophora ornata]
MTTSSTSEPETETSQTARPIMDRKASSPRLYTSPLSVFTSSCTSPASSSAEPPSTLASPLEQEFPGRGSATGTATAIDDYCGSNDFENKQQGYETGAFSTFSLPALTDYTAPTKIQTSMESASAARPSSISARAMMNRSIEQQDVASHVLNGTHDNAAAATTSTSKTKAYAEMNGSQVAPHQQQHHSREEHDNVTFATTPTTTTTTNTTPTSSLILEHNSTLATTDVYMSMASPARNTKLPPNSSSSTSSSTSTGQRKIAESSMILSAGAGPSASSAAVKRGSLSPAWSMTSIPRDISATYSKGYQDQIESPTTAPIDEKLYGLVDRYGFLVEEGRTPTADKNSAMLSTPRRSVRAVNEAKSQAKMVEREQKRSLKWARMAKQYTSDAMETEYSFSNHAKFEPRIYKGIPDCWRASAWSYLITKRSAGFDPNIRQVYHDMQEISSPEEEQIDLDIPRTMHGHIMFRTRYGPGQCALFNVLKAYSNFNHRVGYCQGMASVVATMLTFFDEEKAFILLAQLFDRYSINDLVVPGFPALFEAFFVQEELTKIYAPKVFEALEIMGIETPSYA